MSRNSVLILLLCCGAMAGCAADYLNNYDTMTLASGDAQKHNQLLQTVDPFNPASKNTTIEGDGERAVGVIRKYKGTSPPTTVNTTVSTGTAEVVN